MKTVLTILLAVFSMSVFGQSKWIKQNPLLSVSKVKFLSENTIIKIGDDGIYKTTNNGGEWVNKWSPDAWGSNSNLKLNKIFFIDSLTGWVTDSRFGRILKTTNGGENWEILTDITTGIKDIFFTDENIGWVATATNRTYSPGKLFKTTNGGKDWAIKMSNQNWDFNTIHFSSSDTGWISAENVIEEGRGYVLKTTDAGLNWHELDIGVSLFRTYALRFSDNLNGWLIALHIDYHYDHFNQVYQTTDGGISWTSKYMQAISYNYVNEFCDMKIIDTNNIWIAGDFDNFDILKTSNGGNDWQTVKINPSQNYGSIDYYDTNKIWATGTNLGIAKTNNGGVDWQINPPAISNRFYSVNFMNLENGIAVGDEGIILKTTTGGNSWYTVNSNTIGNLNSVAFIDEYMGWAVGNESIILRTTDAGENWGALPNSYSSDLESVFFINENTGWAIGHLGTILKTVDGGDTWIEKTSDVDKKLSSVFFINDLKGWIVGDETTLLHTTDGGENWTTQNSNISNTKDLHSIHFIDENTGWLISDAGDIAKTMDGGSNWNSSWLGAGVAFNSIFFTDSLNGWAAGHHGIIYHTADGGNNWIKQQTVTNTDFRSLFFNNSTNGYAVGGNGIILKYETTTINTFPESVNLFYPEDYASNLPLSLNLMWSQVSGALNYSVQLAIDPEFNEIVLGQDHILTTTFEVLDLIPNTEYYWRVSASNSFGIGDWSAVWSFNTREFVGSNNWKILNNNINQNFVSISFIETNVGWSTTPVNWPNLSNIYYETTDGSENWRPITTNLQRIDDLLFFDKEIGFAALSQNYGSGFQFARTTDGGINWTQFDHDWSYNAYKVILPSSTIGYALVSGTGLSDYDKKLKRIDLINMTSALTNNPGFGNNRGNNLYADFVDENTGWVVGKEGFSNGYSYKRAYIYKTTSGGSSWELQFEDHYDEYSPDSNPLYLYDVDAIDQNNVWVCGNGKFAVIMNSTDGGATWENKYESNEWFNDIYPYKISFSDPMNGCALIKNETPQGRNDYILQTFDGGETWHAQYLNLSATLYDIQMIDSTTGYVVGNNGLVLKFQDSTTVVGIGNNEENLPTNFELSQNYPNPFNPESKIKFSLPKNSKVVLEVYNILGQKVRELVNTDLSAGYHEVNFNSRGLASGVYIYRMQAKDSSGKNHNQFMEVKKMILLK